MTKKFIAAFIAVLLMSASLVSCGGTPSETQALTTSADTAPAETVTETETDRSTYPDSLPELDFGGETVTIYSRDTEPYSYEMGAEELNGEAVNDAIYARNLSVEEKLNVKISVVRADSVSDSVSKLALAGDPSCDIGAGHGAIFPTLAPAHLLINLLDLDHLDFSQPWWPQGLNTQMTYYDKLYVASGDISLTMVEYLCSVFYNKALCESYGIGDDLAQTAISGGWTLDKMMAYSQQVSSDVDGNSEYDTNDVYGFLQCDSVCIFAFGVGCGLRVIDRGENGDPYIAMDTPKTYSIIDKVNQLFYGSQSSLSAYMPALATKGAKEPDKIETGNRMFINDQALFYVNQLYFMENLRDMESDFGILPYPKYDESQESYISNVRDSYSIFGIPVSSADPSRAAAVMEALAAQSYRTVTPAYYEIALKEKYSRDSETSDILDIITNGVSFDFGVVNLGSLDSIHHVFQWSIEDPTVEFASNYAKYIDKANKLLEKLVTAYKEN
ncbi:MAG: hypothetical protein WCQ72_02185 [Eubacteriales bacterium]